MRLLVEGRVESNARDHGDMFASIALIADLSAPRFSRYISRKEGRSLSDCKGILDVHAMHARWT